MCVCVCVYNHCIYATQLQNASTPTLGYVRVRELVNGRLGKIFKQPQHTIRYIHVYTSVKKHFHKNFEGCRDEQCQKIRETRVVCTCMQQHRG